ncbi:hypothetical protein RRG08_056336 [Elysia crispata]|uniref:Uncharacterized protein n=1 Tax=Elysia crispata TaxID=231223 RepID=A0AAE0YQ91_9GAST|nr:hypothetical protein RRG08_056336 [Elysia crispata]
MVTWSSGFVGERRGVTGYHVLSPGHLMMEDIYGQNQELGYLVSELVDRAPVESRLLASLIYQANEVVVVFDGPNAASHPATVCLLKYLAVAGKYWVESTPRQTVATVALPTQDSQQTPPEAYLLS